MKKIIAVILVVILLVLSGCTSDETKPWDETDQVETQTPTNRFIVEPQEDNLLGAGSTYIIVDTETGVKYLFVKMSYSGGLTVLQEGDE